MPIEIVLTEDQLQLLNELAAQEGLNQSQMVAEALRFWVENI